MLPMEGDCKYRPLLNEKYSEAQPRVSHDGRWIAYTSNESGKNEVYVRPFPGVEAGRWPVSTSGGDSPLWSPTGRELFYRSGDAVMAVAVKTEPTFSLGLPTVLFRGAYDSTAVGSGDLSPWDISPDGKRFLMIKQAMASTSKGGGPRKINVVLNWTEELKQRVPVK
jgi:eukaryotic-like serine/threonine-protein kinase